MVHAVRTAAAAAVAGFVSAALAASPVVGPPQQPLPTTGDVQVKAHPRPVSPSIRRATFRTEPTRRALQRVAEADATGYATVGVTWSGSVAPADLTVEVRTAVTGVPGWGEWEELELEPSTDGVVDGTEPLVVGEVARVQARVTGLAARTITDLALSVIDPGTSGADATVPTPDPAQSASGSAVAAAAPPAPTIYSRATWGADESMMTWTPRQGDVRGAAIHHTAGTNTYTSAQVPSILRGIYAYHAKTRGWGDIGYNFLVDKYGRIWEGRAGGITRETIGGHTVGFNAYSTGISVLGNYETATVSNATVDAIVALASWKLALHGVPASGTTTINGVTLNRIFGHRDAAYTACPGRTLYVRLDEIRRRATAAQAADTGTPEVPDIAAGTVIRHRVTRDIAVAAGSHRLLVERCALLQHYGKRCADAVTVSPSVWDSFSGQRTLRRTYELWDGRLFSMDDGARREAADAAALTAAGLSTPVVRGPLAVISSLPYGVPIVRERTVVTVRGSTSRYLVVDGTKAALPWPVLNQTPLSTLPRRVLDAGSLERMTTSRTVNGIVRPHLSSKIYLLTRRGALNITRTGDLRPGTEPARWTQAYLDTLPQVERRPGPVAVKLPYKKKVFLIRDGRRVPSAGPTWLRRQFDGSDPVVHVIAKTTMYRFPLVS